MSDRLKFSVLNRETKTSLGEFSISSVDYHAVESELSSYDLSISAYRGSLVVLVDELDDGARANRILKSYGTFEEFHNRFSLINLDDADCQMFAITDVCLLRLQRSYDVEETADCFRICAKSDAEFREILKLIDGERL